MRLARTEMLSLAELPGPARATAAKLLLSLGGDDKRALLDLLAEVRRATMRRESDRSTDPERRVLVGPRLPRSMVARYRAAADARGQSLYRWATEALEAHLAEQDITQDVVSTNGCAQDMGV